MVVTSWCLIDCRSCASVTRRLFASPGCWGKNKPPHIVWGHKAHKQYFLIWEYELKWSRISCDLEQRPPPLRDEIYIGITSNSLNIPCFLPITLERVRPRCRHWCRAGAVYGKIYSTQKHKAYWEHRLAEVKSVKAVQNGKQIQRAKAESKGGGGAGKVQEREAQKHETLDTWNVNRKTLYENKERGEQTVC